MSPKATRKTSTAQLPPRAPRLIPARGEDHTIASAGKLMWKLADLIEQHAEEFAQLESLDNGKPVTVARVADVPGTSRHVPLHGRMGHEDRRQYDSDLRSR